MNTIQKILLLHKQEGNTLKYEERSRQILAEGSSSVEIEALIESLTTAPK